MFYAIATLAMLLSGLSFTGKGDTSYVHKYVTTNIQNTFIYIHILIDKLYSVTKTSELNNNLSKQLH